MLNIPAALFMKYSSYAGACVLAHACVIMCANFALK